MDPVFLLKIEHEEIKEILTEMGLVLGMKLDNFEPPVVSEDDETDDQQRREGRDLSVASDVHGTEVAVKRRRNRIAIHVDRPSFLKLPPLSHGVKVFERKPDRIDQIVAARTGRIGPMLSKSFPNRQIC